MRQSKLIARVLNSFLKVIAISYFLVLMYSLFCIGTGYGINISEDGEMKYIQYPFSDKIFLIMQNNIPYILFSFLLPLILYSLFFYLTSNVFRVFAMTKLFTRENANCLRLFYRYNLFVPFPVTLLASFFVEILNSIWLLVLLHFILGIFIYFLAEIFSQGIGLQDEQELYI
ncbi:DUF2975 domain-containing protein [Echinicola shivajiensis]|uniref:DUF2975 domain-containing protein n=1 Tax=Echinicola shivajiensis TaxID=1035916 RepID=UPI001BFCB0E6|nr:DUF2975 domain-containing protein [Echinicola shivajiensis]